MSRSLDAAFCAAASTAGLSPSAALRRSMEAFALTPNENDEAPAGNGRRVGTPTDDLEERPERVGAG